MKAKNIIDFHPKFIDAMKNYSREKFSADVMAAPEPSPGAVASPSTAPSSTARTRGVSPDGGAEANASVRTRAPPSATAARMTVKSMAIRLPHEPICPSMWTPPSGLATKDHGLSAYR